MLKKVTESGNGLKKSGLLAGKIFGEKPKRAGSESASAGVPANPFPGLAACVADVKSATSGKHANGGKDPGFGVLIKRLKSARKHWPEAFGVQVIDPFVKTLSEWKPEGLRQTLLDKERSGALVRDVFEAILQHADNPDDKALNAFLEVAWDLYAGFFDPADRKTLKPPRHEPLPPLVKFGGYDAPRTWTVEQTARLRVQTGIVCLPEGSREGGLLAWAVLAHEVCGHDFVDAHPGLRQELAKKVTAEIQASKIDPRLADYWCLRIEEASSDVLGILDLGPAAAIATIGFLRGMNHGAGGKLDNVIVSESGRYPADILRGYLAAATVRLLPFADASAWADFLEEELAADSVGMTIDGNPVGLVPVRESATILARAICSTPLQSLQNLSFGGIQTWKDQEDEAVVQELRNHLKNAPGKVLNPIPKDCYPAHIVAAAVTASVRSEVSPKTAFKWMIRNLDRMHRKNATWGLQYGTRVLAGRPIRTPWTFA